MFNTAKIIKSHGVLCGIDNAQVSNLILITTTYCNNLEHVHFTQ